MSNDQKPLTAAQIEQGWRDTFSTGNPFCPCDLKTFTKAARWAEANVRRAAIASAEQQSPSHSTAGDTP